MKCLAHDCDKQFEPNTWNQIFCSSKCNRRTKSRNERSTRTSEKNDFYNIAINKRRQTVHGRFLKLIGTSQVRFIPVEITEAQYADLIKDNRCFYCDEQLFDGTTFRTCIDRYNHKLGYVLGNCRPCCWRCNEIKGSLERWFSPERSIELLKEVIGDNI